MEVEIPSTGKPCTKCGEGDGNPLHNGICNVCYVNSLSKEEMEKTVKDAYNNAMKKARDKQGVEIGKKKDLFAVWGLIFGVASAFLGMGLITIIAIILSAIGINKTKETGSGRWMAVTGLVLGILYFLIYLADYGHI